MTVRELINELQKIPNQNLEVRMAYDMPYDDCGCMECYLEEGFIGEVFISKTVLGKPVVYLYEGAL